MTDDYAWWRDALAGSFGQIHEGEPHAGFYRRKLFSGRGAPWAPVAIFADGGGRMVALQSKVVINKPSIIDAADVWSWCAQHPIPEDVYRAVAESSQPWPSGIEQYSLKRNAA
jgi:hypothetical protein